MESNPRDGQIDRRRNGSALGNGDKELVNTSFERGDSKLQVCFYSFKNDEKSEEIWVFKVENGSIDFDIDLPL